MQFRGPFTSTAQKPARALEFFTCENSIDLGLPSFGLWDLWQFWSPLLRLSRLRRRPTSDRFQVLLWLASLRGAPGISPFHGDRTARDNALSSRLSAFARVGRDTRPRRCERFVRRPANNQRVNSPLVGYMHNNANVHFMHARSSSLFHLVVHAIYYRTIVR